MKYSQQLESYLSSITAISAKWVIQLFVSELLRSFKFSIGAYRDVRGIRMEWVTILFFLFLKQKQFIFLLFC